MPTTNETQWFYLSGGKRNGPFTEAELLTAVDNDKLKPEDLVWTNNDPDATLARDVEGLFATPSQTLETFLQPVHSITPAGPTITCPYCWHRFSADTVLFIAGHQDLIGDHVLGQHASQRFLPSRFTPEGLAIDAGGVACPDMACPRCHLRMPAALFHCKPLLMSIVGATGSGKSYYLASTTWKLRATLPKQFGITFTDVDAETNSWLNGYEEKLFLQKDTDAIQIIVKTEQQASHVYTTVTLNGMPIVLPLPCMFNMRASHSNNDDDGRCLVLYDNAGEHFQAGRDTTAAPGTQHLAHSEGIMFFFDLSADPRLTPYLKEPAKGNDANQMHRQDVLLVETITRIQRRLGLNSTTRYKKPFVVVLSKADLLDHLDLSVQPYIKLADGRHALDMDVITTYSYWCRSTLMQTVPEIVNTVESFADHVIYLPVSALGYAPDKAVGVQPKCIHPQWVDVPPLYILSHLGMIPRANTVDSDVPSAEQVEQRGRILNLTVPGTSTRLEVPTMYCGHAICCPRTGKRFLVPELNTLSHD